MSGRAPPAFGLLGWPVGHSRSPAIWRAAFAAARLDATYAAFEVRPADLPDAVRGARALGLAGFNVTVPHKTAILPWLDEVRGDARALGAVNVVTPIAGRLVGDNTDAEGLARALADAAVALEGAPAAVVGAGGAARAAVLALARRGAGEVRVAARRPEAAAALARALAPAVGVAVHPASLGAPSWARGVHALVQATDATLARPGTPPDAAAAFAAGLPLDAVARDCVVVDLVYDPRRTAVLERAAARGLRTADGLGMLVHQAALAFERWCGAPAPLDAMRAAATEG